MTAVQSGFAKSFKLAHVWKDASNLKKNHLFESLFSIMRLGLFKKALQVLRTDYSSKFYENWSIHVIMFLMPILYLRKQAYSLEN